MCSPRFTGSGFFDKYDTRKGPGAGFPERVGDEWWEAPLKTAVLWELACFMP